MVEFALIKFRVGKQNKDESFYFREIWLRRCNEYLESPVNKKNPS